MHKLGTKSSPPQSIPLDRNFRVIFFRGIQFIQAKLGFFHIQANLGFLKKKNSFLGGVRGKFLTFLP